MWQDHNPNLSQRSVWSLMGTSLVDSVVVVGVGDDSLDGWVSSGGSVGEGWGLSGFRSLESSPHVGLWRVGSGSVVNSWVSGGLREEGTISFGVWGGDRHGASNGDKGEEFHHY